MLKKIFEDEIEIYLKEIGKDSRENKELFNKFISVFALVRREIGHPSDHLVFLVR